MLVNDADEAREVTLRIPGVHTRSLTRYHYFDADRPTDASGFPKPAATMRADLDRGLAVSFPARGVVFLTTRNDAPKPGARP